jgi:hypothetical protein
MSQGNAEFTQPAADRCRADPQPDRDGVDRQSLADVEPFKLLAAEPFSHHGTPPRDPLGVKPAPDQRR